MENIKFEELAKEGYRVDIDTHKDKCIIEHEKNEVA